MRIGRIFERDAASGEITSALGCRRHQCFDGIGLATIAEALVGTKREQAILFDGTPGSKAKLVLLQIRNPRLEEIPGIESIVSQELPNGAMKIVAARLRDHIHLGARVAAVFSCEIVSQYPNLLHGIGRRIIHARIAGGVVEVTPVEREEIHVGATTIYVHFWTAARVTKLLRSFYVQDSWQNASK